MWSWSSSDTDAEARVANVQFIVGDIASLTRAQSIDVVVGRPERMPSDTGLAASFRY